MGNCQNNEDYDCGRDYELCYCTKRKPHDQNQYRVFMTPKNIHGAQTAEFKAEIMRIRNTPKTIENIVKL